MTFKNKLICLSILIAIFALVYAGSFIFSRDMDNTRSASHLWLDSSAAGRINRFVINSSQDKLEFTKKSDQWFITRNNSEYPARRLRVEDFLSVFTTRAQWPVRSSSGAANDRFGLDERAARITFYSDYSIILDLLLGDDDVMGLEMYFREAGRNEIRSGNSSIRVYITGEVTSWYNLRLIPESADGSVSINSAQRLTVFNEGASQVFTRSNRSWDVSGVNVENPDMSKIEEYINFVINAEGEDFIDSVSASSMDFNYSRIMIEFGNGSVVTILISGPDEVNKRYARVSNSGYIYQLPLWVTTRLFRNAESFE